MPPQFRRRVEDPMNLTQIVQKLNHEYDALGDTLNTLGTIVLGVTGVRGATATVRTARTPTFPPAPTFPPGTPARGTPARGTISPAGRHRIAIAQKARWAKAKAKGMNVVSGGGTKKAA